jgi:hypothetical protein
MREPAAIRLRLGSGETVFLARGEVDALLDKLRDADSLEGAISLTAHLKSQLGNPILAGQSIELLAREENALRAVFDDRTLEA